MKLKDGKSSSGKKILIDGQQRITALTAAILGKAVKNTEYEDVHIKIAFNPKERKFEVSNPAIQILLFNIHNFPWYRAPS